MEYLVLLGIVIVVIGFSLKIDSILIIMLAMLVTALAGGVNVIELLEIIGSTFVANRTMAIFIPIMLVTGTLERNGLKESAAKLIGKFKGSTSGFVLSIYAVMRSVFAAFNVGFGGVAGFVRPIIMPMAVGAIESKGIIANEDHVEDIKGMAAGVENITWFFCQVLFIGGAGGMLVKTTLEELGIIVELADLAAAEIPVAIFAVLLAIVYYSLKDRRLRKKYYGETIAPAEGKGE